MSPSPTSRADAGRAGSGQLHVLRKRLARAWSGARGRVPRYTVYLQAQGVLSWRVDARAAASDAPGQATAFESFATWCAAHRGVDVQLRVSGQLIHSLAIDAALQLHDPARVRRYALQQFTHYHGPQAAGWPLAVWAEGAQCVACSLHGVDLAALRNDAGTHEIRLLGMIPAWSAGLATLTAIRPEFAGSQRHALLLVEGSAATWLVAEDGVVVTLRQRLIDTPRIDAVERLLAALVLESPPLAAPPIVAGWGIEAPAALPVDRASTFGELSGPGSMIAWMRGRPS